MILHPAYLPAMIRWLTILRLVIVVLILTLSSTADAQHRRQRKRQPAKPAARQKPDVTKIQRTAAVQPPHEKGVWTEYDAVTFTTNVGINFVPLEGKTFAGKHLAASFEYPGREPRMPDGIKLLLMNVVTKPSGVEEEDGELVITVDGMELFTGEARYLGANERVPSGLPLLYGAKIPVEVLLAISRSQRAEVRVGADKYTLTADSLQMLHLLAAHLAKNKQN